MWEGDPAVEPEGDVEGGVAVEHDAPEGRVLDLLEDGAVGVGAEGEDGRAHLVAGNINYLLINFNYLIDATLCHQEIVNQELSLCEGRKKELIKLKVGRIE